MSQKPPDAAMCATCKSKFQPRNSPMVFLGPHDTVDGIRDWLDRHREDDDPPKIAVAYVDHLLRLLDGR